MICWNNNESSNLPDEALKILDDNVTLEDTFFSLLGLIGEQKKQRGIVNQEAREKKDSDAR